MLHLRLDSHIPLENHVMIVAIIWIIPGHRGQKSCVDSNYQIGQLAIHVLIGVCMMLHLRLDPHIPLENHVMIVAIIFISHWSLI